MHAFVFGDKLHHPIKQQRKKQGSSTIALFKAYVRAERGIFCSVFSHNHPNSLKIHIFNFINQNSFDSKLLGQDCPELETLHRIIRFAYVNENQGQA